MALLLSSFALALLTAGAQASAQSSTRYRLAFSEARRRVVHVEAVVQTSGPELLMSVSGATHLENRWAEFVEELDARDAKGRPVRLKSSGGARWKIVGRVPDELHLAYVVRLDHDLAHWPFGWNSATYVKDDCIYLSTDALFITSPRVERAEVSFDLPPDWKVSSAWEEIAGDSWAFAVEDFEDLTRSSLLVGEHEERRFYAVDAEWRVAAGGRLADQIDLLAETLEVAVDEAVLIFGEVPAERYLLAANRADYTGGSAHVGSMSLVLGERPTPDDTLWSYVMVHELMHMWNGVTMRRRTSAAEWFNEGVTDYLAVLVLARAGLADAEAVRERLTSSYQMYERAQRSFDELSLADAGADKVTRFDAVYGGGFWMGLLLDLELRAASGGEESIESLMRSLYDRHLEGRISYDVRDLTRLSGEIAGRSLAKFFQRHVSGHERIPVASYLARMGYVVEEVGRGRRRQSVVALPGRGSTRQAELRRALFGGPVGEGLASPER